MPQEEGLTRRDWNESCAGQLALKEKLFCSNAGSWQQRQEDRAVRMSLTTPEQDRHPGCPEGRTDLSPVSQQSEDEEKMTETAEDVHTTLEQLALETLLYISKQCLFI
ncbi:uncharacterized protein LOC144376052 isoform X2 [Ictidomys tridecemlineatus]